MSPANSLAALIDEGEPALAAFDDEQLQRVFGLLVHEYAKRVLAATETPLAPYTPQAGIAATEALVVAGQILRTAEISSFELATILNI